MIQVHFYLPRTLFEKAVSFFGKTKYCHVAIQYGHWVFESTAGKGIILRSNPRSEKSDAYFVLPSKSYDEINDWVDGVLKSGDTNYGYFDCAQRVIKEWTRLDIGGNVRGFTCVEAAIYFMREMCQLDIEYIKGMKPDMLSVLLRNMSCQSLQTQKS